MPAKQATRWMARASPGFAGAPAPTVILHASRRHLRQRETVIFSATCGCVDLFAGFSGNFDGLTVPLFALAGQAFELRYQHAFRQMPPEPPGHVQAQGIGVEASRVEGMAVIGAP